MSSSSRTLPRDAWTAPVGVVQVSFITPRDWASWQRATVLAALLLTHLLLGWLMSGSAAVATAHAAVVAAAAPVLALSVARPTVMLGVCSYIAGSEVLWRMCNAAIFWESAKYLMAAALVIALARRRHVCMPTPAVFYFAFLLPSALLTLAHLDWTTARQQLSFNLLGPFTLALAVIYFSDVRLRMRDLVTPAAALTGPVTATTAVVVLRMAGLGEIDFAMDSNFGASGGFGPNQVAAIFGLGALFCLIAVLFCRLGLVERLSALALCAGLLLQSAVTFSRGGAYLALAAAGAAALLLWCVRPARHRLFLATGVLGAVALAAIPYADTWTGGLLIERFTTPDLTHRDGLVRDDLSIWVRNPMFGVGPGRASGERGTEFGGAAAHTEFTRALAEHGLFGLAAVTILGWMIWRRFSAAVVLEEKALLAALFVWPLLFMAVNSMRIAAPSLLFGMAFARWVPEEPAAPRALARRLATR